MVHDASHKRVWNTRVNKVSTMAIDALAPCVTISSPNIELDMQAECFFILQEETFQLPGVSFTTLD